MVKKKCYLFGTKKLTWQEAYWHCNDLNATLALLESNKEDVALKNMIKKHNKCTVTKIDFVMLYLCNQMMTNYRV